MKEVYRKFGRVARFENGKRIEVTEAGEAIETEETFIATPLDVSSRASAARRGIPLDFAVGIPPLAALGRDDTFERLILTHGIALHQFNDIEWREETRRLHVSLTHEKLRVLIDLDDFDFDLIRRIADRLQRATGERESPRQLLLAPHVARSLWPEPRGRDGKGQLIAERSTYWYRPSYRVRPILKALELRSNGAHVDASLPQAIAIVDGNRLLIDDGHSVYPARAR